jgi:endonuclease III
MHKIIRAQDLNIDLENANEEGLFKWLVASFLMGKRIQAQIAAEAYRVIVVKHQRDTPRKLANCTHRELVAMLGEAHYVRYDETTAARLLALANKLHNDYAGKVSSIVAASTDRRDFESRLAAFEGIGPKTIEIFMREGANAIRWNARASEAKQDAPGAR